AQAEGVASHAGRCGVPRGSLRDRAVRATLEGGAVSLHAGGRVKAMTGPRVVFTAGVFDLLHRGHINLLWRSRRLGDVLVVGVVSDPGVRAYKGALPVETVQQRMAAVRALGFVDVVVYQPDTDPTPLLERFRPDVFTHGDDWARLLKGHETLERLGIEWVTLPYTPDVSTTILRRDMATAEAR